MASVFPKHPRIFNKVSSCGVLFPVSIRAITGCFTPLNSSNCFWLIPNSFLARMSSLIIATLKSVAAISSWVNKSFLISFQLLPIAVLLIFSLPIFKFSLTDIITQKLSILNTFKLLYFKNKKIIIMYTL